MMRLFWVAVLLLLPFSGTAAAVDYHYQGTRTLFQDTVWEGDVLVDGILTVAPNVTLEIRPGTVVRFTRYDSNADGIGEHEIFSQGTIRALGTAAAPVVFTSAEADPRRGDWGAINMMVSEQDNRLEHCRVEYGYRGFHAHFSRAELHHSTFRNNLRGAQFQESRVVIEDCRFVDNTNGLQFRDSQVDLSGVLVARNQWGIRCVYSEVQIRNCDIEANLVNGINIRDGKLTAVDNRVQGNRRGIYLQRSQGVVRGNRLEANSEHGIFLEDSSVEVVANRIVGNGRAGVRWLNGSGRLAGNLIVENGVYALINDGTTEVRARNNWWGSPDPDRVALAVRDGRDRPGLGLTDYRYPLRQPLALPHNLE